MPFFADLPPQLQERVVCSISAAVKYEVPVNIVLAVAEKEGGKPGQIRFTDVSKSSGLQITNAATGLPHSVGGGQSHQHAGVHPPARRLAP